MSGKCACSRVHANVVFIGHLSHGKSELVSAISARLDNKEMSGNTSGSGARGGTVTDTGHFDFFTKTHHFFCFDCPGHVDCIKSMVAGDQRMSCAVFVVSASDGLVSQAREHLMLAFQTGIKKVVVFINKVDIVEGREAVDLTEMETRELLDRCGYDGTVVPCVRGSALCAVCGVSSDIGESKIDELLSCLVDQVGVPCKVENESLLLPIEKVFDASADKDVIVSGYVESGILSVGDIVDLIGYGECSGARCTSIETLGDVVQRTGRGDVALVSLECDSAVRSGQVVCSPGSVTQHSVIESHLYVFTRDEGGRGAPLFSGGMIVCRIGTSEVESNIELPFSVVVVMPGTGVRSAKISLSEQIPVRDGMCFAIYEGGELVGRGTVTKVLL